MKVSNKSNLAAGIILLLLAAFFSISLILQPLDFGQFGPGHQNILYRLGAMLTGVYGFTSILIPVFLFTAAISCFASKWTARKSMRLLTAVVPFFTCFGAEKLCYFFAAGENFTGLKISVTLIVALMLVVIEFLLAGIAADKINGTTPVRPQPDYNDDDEETESDDYYAPEPNSSGSYDDLSASENEQASAGFASNKDNNDDEIYEEEETAPYNMDGTSESEEDNDSAKPRISLFSRLAERRKEREENKAENDGASDAGSENENVYEDSVLPSEKIATEQVEKEFAEKVGTADDPFADVFEQPFSTDSKDSDNSTKILDEDSEFVNQAEKADTGASEDSADDSDDNNDDETPSAPGSIITQEEYAALTGFNEEEEKTDELEWPDTNEIQAKAGNVGGDTSDFESFDSAIFDDEESDDSDDDSDAVDSDGEDEDDGSAAEDDASEDETEEVGSISFQDEDLFEDLDSNIPEGEILCGDDEEDNLDKGVKKCGVQEMSVFGNPDSEEDDSETLEKDFEDSFSVYEDSVLKEESEEEEEVSPSAFDDTEIDETDEAASDEEIADKLLEGYEGYADEENASYNTDEASDFETVYEETDESETAYDSSDDADEKSDEDYSGDSAEDFDDSEDSETTEDSSSSAFDDFTEIKNTPDAVLRQQRYEEQQKKSSLTSEVFDDMENDIRKEVKKEFLYKRYGAPEDFDEEYAENDSGSVPSEDNGFSENEEITVPVVKGSYGDDTNYQNAANTNAGNSYAEGAGTSNIMGGTGASGRSMNSLNAQNGQNLSAQNVQSSRAQPKKPYFVPTELLEQYADDQYWIIDNQTKEDAAKLKETLNEFGISAEIVGIKKGPVVTMFELAPAPGVKLNRIVSLQDNIALSLAANSVRIVAPIPGRAAVGIEVPNRKRSIVSFREMIEQDLPEFKKMAIPVILGKDILGKSQIIDIAKTPHLLIAGATGAGKSVCVNSIILSILYKRSPKQVKMILVDPKVVELKLYNDIPHLLTPVITEPKKALQALQYCLCEMERRYALLDQMGVRDISSYNTRIEERNICTEKLPYIVIIIDEFADLMATSGKELESNVARLAAMSRAVGIHLVLATQRPSANVITGLIKANIPSRIAFMVASRIDSNIIIDSVGAEKLLGKGDMLYASAVDPYPIRIQGTFESDNDVDKVVEYVKTLGEPEYIDDEIFVDDEEEEDSGVSLFNEGSDPLYEQALDIVIQSGKASASYIQRRLKIGYNRAARLVEEMEERGIVGPANGSKPREIIHVPS